MAVDRENVAGLVKKAKEALSRKDFSTYWDTVFGIAASLGGNDGDENEEDDEDNGGRSNRDGARQHQRRRRAAPSGGRRRMGRGEHRS